ncbi:MAG: glycosyl hydrolase, partial [Verrucomicrobia bacterium]|nr:glycosyl hydrolase [Verrucomicrobiota bacterium]
MDKSIYSVISSSIPFSKRLLLAVGVAFALYLPEPPAVLAGDALTTGFAQPPASARPWVYWFWMDGNITKEGITADLEAMKRVGIGGMILMDVTGGIPEGRVKYAGSEWYDMVKHAAQDASRLGLEICIYNCGGYTSSGGPWTTVDHAMQTVVTSEKMVHGPMNFNAVLPQPPKKLDTYHDSAVL